MSMIRVIPEGFDIVGLKCSIGRQTGSIINLAFVMWPRCRESLEFRIGEEEMDENSLPFAKKHRMRITAMVLGLVVPILTLVYTGFVILYSSANTTSKVIVSMFQLLLTPYTFLVCSEYCRYYCYVYHAFNVLLSLIGFLFIAVLALSSSEFKYMIGMPLVLMVLALSGMITEASPDNVATPYQRL